MIRVDNLVKRFGIVDVLRGASLEVERGETAVIIGASGGGKSTLLRCINALESFDDGRIHVDDMTLEPRANGDARELHLRLRRRVGMVFQQFHLFPHLSVLENVMSGPIHALGKPRDEAEPMARSLLERVGLADKAHQRPATLSGGQQQRVAIARALANEPEVMLFDEPTSALDPRMTGEVLSVMADLSRSGQTMLVVSHAMGFVRRSAHRVHVMADGQVIESGLPAQIFEEPRDPRTRDLLEEAAS
ncbi:MAG: amino acid ABC transporter ATP-binding protein [Planctomycetota bacterium]|nr:MAG: amino acid ABC transporter ATP-binding protein [Planctomycetota bacterium]